jgi:hypothetical protein
MHMHIGRMGRFPSMCGVGVWRRCSIVEMKESCIVHPCFRCQCIVDVCLGQIVHVVGFILAETIVISHVQYDSVTRKSRRSLQRRQYSSSVVHQSSRQTAYSGGNADQKAGERHFSTIAMRRILGVCRKQETKSRPMRL